jgi:hypothetical protein
VSHSSNWFQHGDGDHKGWHSTPPNPTPKGFKETLHARPAVRCQKTLHAAEGIDGRSSPAENSSIGSFEKVPLGPTDIDINDDEFQEFQDAHVSPTGSEFDTLQTYRINPCDNFVTVEFKVNRELEHNTSFQ